MGWVRRDLKNHLFLSPSPGQGCHSLNQIAQAPLSLALSTSIHNLSGQHLPCSNSHCVEILERWKRISFRKKSELKNALLELMNGVPTANKHSGSYVLLTAT